MGGIGSTVQIGTNRIFPNYICIFLLDEALVAKRKYRRVRWIFQNWIFGMYDTTRRIGILKIIGPRRTANVIHPLIQVTYAFMFCYLIDLGTHNSWLNHPLRQIFCIREHSSEPLKTYLSSCAFTLSPLVGEPYSVLCGPDNGHAHQQRGKSE